MHFKEIGIAGAYLLELEKREDERGFFARTFCKQEFAMHGLMTEFVQCNITYTIKRGTLRGMHYQISPYEEVKVVSCVMGTIYDVILDVRDDSPTYGQWIAIELSVANGKMIYVPKGVAHGFQALKDESVVCYFMGEFYQPENARGVRWNDERFSIEWPIKNPILSLKDQSW